MPVNTQGQIVDEMGKPTGQTVDLNTGAVGGTQIPASQGTAPMNQIATPSAPSINVQNLQPGMKGSDVSGLQNFLIGQGYAIPAGATGYYGPQTQQALAQFQQKSGIDTAGNPGYFGPRTKSFIAQNTELANKFQSYFEQVKGSLAPENSADARMSLSELNKEQPDVQKEFQNILESMNPFEMQIYQNMSQLNSSQQDQQLLRDMFTQEYQKAGLPGLNMEFADTKRIMDGTEDDIREEITRAGGFATESQIQAMTAARNKTLLRKASYLSDLINAKNDYLNNIVSLTKADREQADRDFDKKLNLKKQLFDMSQSMQNNAKENFKYLVDKVGWSGLAKTLQNDPAQLTKVEKLFGLAPGEIQKIAANELHSYQFQTLTTEDALGNKVQKLIAVDPRTGQAVGVVGTGGKIAFNGTPSGVLEGEYSGVIRAAANLVGTERGKASLANMAQALSNNNYKLAYAQIANNVEEALTGTNKTKFADSRTDYNVMQGLREAVQNYANNGGDMGLLTGKEEEIKRKLGIDSGKATELAVQLWREFQAYRSNMTGAAFSAEESRDYASVNPTLGKSLNLNLSVIDGALNQLRNRITGTIEARVPGAQKIYEKIPGAVQSDGLTNDEAYRLYLQKTKQ